MGPERGGYTNIVSASAPAPRAGDEYVSLYPARTRGPGCAGMENRVSGINDIENDREQIGNGFARPPDPRRWKRTSELSARPGPHLPPHPQLSTSTEAHACTVRTWSRFPTSGNLGSNVWEGDTPVSRSKEEILTLTDF